jgi:hypothetical protein
MLPRSRNALAIHAKLKRRVLVSVVTQQQGAYRAQSCHSLWQPTASAGTRTWDGATCVRGGLSTPRPVPRHRMQTAPCVLSIEVQVPKFKIHLANVGRSQGVGRADNLTGTARPNQRRCRSHGRARRCYLRWALVSHLVLHRYRPHNKPDGRNLPAPLIMFWTLQIPVTNPLKTHQPLLDTFWSLDTHVVSAQNTQQVSPHRQLVRTPAMFPAHPTTGTQPTSDSQPRYAISISVPSTENGSITF